MPIARSVIATRAIFPRLYLLGLIIATLALGAVPGCQQVGPRAQQTAEAIDEATPGPSQTRMVDVERGTLTTTGTGPTSWKRLDADGVETVGTGVAPRTLYWDSATKRFVFDSGTDISAEDVRVDVFRDRTTIDIGRFATLTSEPTRAVNEAYADLETYWRSLTQAQKDARIAELEAMKAAGDAFAGVLLPLLRSIGV
ncbi:MAG: hypothetical protein L6Q35_00505 [Phycisphaerales bacterium]|nr:hypothetical protein [Phycisphaerales bacterium]